LLFDAISGTVAHQSLSHPESTDVKSRTIVINPRRVVGGSFRPMMDAIKTPTKLLVNFALGLLGANQRRRIKEYFELKFWKQLHQEHAKTEAELERERSHYQYFFTEFFSLPLEYYRGKRVLDIGCGPMGSLEWASEAAERVGLDPLSDKYLELGAAKHAMKYVNAPSEKIPFPSGHFNVVATLNSLDHVEDVQRTIEEIKRVTAPGGYVLLITEMDHQPTFTEPHKLDRSVLSRFEPEFSQGDVRYFGERDDHQIYKSLTEKVPYTPGERGILCAKLVRR
jgi:ubiquinone/menaquinone biosynthesis C-methylase UbiE